MVSHHGNPSNKLNLVRWSFSSSGLVLLGWLVVFRARWMISYHIISFHELLSSPMASLDSCSFPPGLLPLLLVYYLILLICSLLPPIPCQWRSTCIVWFRLVWIWDRTVVFWASIVHLYFAVQILCIYCAAVICHTTPTPPVVNLIISFSILLSKANLPSNSWISWGLCLL